MRSYQRVRRLLLIYSTRRSRNTHYQAAGLGFSELSEHPLGLRQDFGLLSLARPSIFHHGNPGHRAEPYTIQGGGWDSITVVLP